MNEIEIIFRVILEHAYCYNNTTMIEFNEKFINDIVPKLNELFTKYGYKSNIFIKDEESGTYKNFKKLMLSIFEDTIYNSDKLISKNCFGLYDDEMECLDMIHLSYSEAKKWDDLIGKYKQQLIEGGSYIFTNNSDVYESERNRTKHL